MAAPAEPARLRSVWPPGAASIPASCPGEGRGDEEAPALIMVFRQYSKDFIGLAETLEFISIPTA
jgi:hypothetical protein